MNHASHNTLPRAEESTAPDMIMVAWELFLVPNVLSGFCVNLG